jgi:hypothetical protein
MDSLMERSAFIVMLNDTPIAVSLNETWANTRVRKLKKEWNQEQAKMTVLRAAQSFRRYYVKEVPLEE